MGRGSDHVTCSSQDHIVISHSTKHPGICRLDWVSFDSGAQRFAFILIEFNLSAGITRISFHFKIYDILKCGITELKFVGALLKNIPANLCRKPITVFGNPRKCSKGNRSHKFRQPWNNVKIDVENPRKIIIKALACATMCYKAQ